MEQRFAGKTVVVTGAGSGIGAATACRFGEEGANVVLSGTTAEKLDRVAAKMDGARTLVKLCDVSDPRAVDALMAAAVEQFGRIDVLVSNAGVVVFKPFGETTFEDWRKTMAVDLDGAFLCAKAALPHLLETKGSIVHTGSVSGIGGDWNMTAYNAAKGGLSNFTRALALDLGKQGVRVNAVAPSFTETGMTGDMVADKAVIEKFDTRMPLGAPIQPEDVAAAIAFLASDDARMITGVVLPVDGGVTASSGQPQL